MYDKKWKVGEQIINLLYQIYLVFTYIYMIYKQYNDTIYSIDES